jgi:Cys-tRNA(Pro)/Cys-tRNA(Cys) deacylase
MLELIEMSPVVNNITRLLEARRIKYTAFELPVQKIGALEAASLLGVDAERVYKTIVVTRDRPLKNLLVLVAGTRSVDLKLLAAALGDRKLHLPSEREAEALTGLQAGGISPLALLNRGFQVVIDAATHDYEAIHISGGQRGLNIRLAVADLARLTGARFASVSRAGGT